MTTASKSNVLAFSQRPAEHVMDGGYIHLMRREYVERDSVFGDDWLLISVWVAMICHAAWKPVEVQVGETWLRLQRKQLVFSYREWAGRWRMTKSQMYEVVQRLARHGRVKLETRRVENGPQRVATIMTIVNYDRYNPLPDQTGFKQGPNSQSQAERGFEAVHQTSFPRHPDNYDSDKELKKSKIKPESRTSSESRRKRSHSTQPEEIQSPNGDSSACADLGADPQASFPGIPAGPPDLNHLSQEAVKIWNETCGELLPKVHKLTPERAKRLKVRLRDDFHRSVEGWRTCCRKVAASSFLTGQCRPKAGSDHPFAASFDWCISPTNLRKILEGNYDDRAYQPESDRDRSNRLARELADEWFERRAR
jgi:hypothetical protein